MKMSCLIVSFTGCGGCFCDLEIPFEITTESSFNTEESLEEIGFDQTYDDSSNFQWTLMVVKQGS